MPKEITHWLLAEKTVAQLPGTRLGDAAQRYPHLVKIGAVFPDLPYYVTGQNERARHAQALGSRYHGAGGEDTYELLRQILGPPGHRLPETRLAFMAGVASHLQVDMIFHPGIYYWTGNYYDPDPARRTRAIRNHRRFEALLDLRICGGLAQARAFSARQIWTRLEGPPLAWLDWAEASSQPVLAHAAHVFLKAQGLFIQPLLSRLVQCLAPWLPSPQQELAALFYTPNLAKYVSRLAGPLEYHHPVSGQARTTTLEELMAQAVAGGAALCRRLEAALAAGAAAAFPDCGPSLNFGLAGADIAQAWHFAPTPFF